MSALFDTETCMCGLCRKWHHHEEGVWNASGAEKAHPASLVVATTSAFAAELIQLTYFVLNTDGGLGMDWASYRKMILGALAFELQDEPDPESIAQYEPPEADRN